MNKSRILLLGALTLLSLTACTYVPKIGMKEAKWLNNSFSSELVYIDGDVKAYRYSGSYYYFSTGRLTKVTTNLVTADKVEKYEKKK